MSNNQICGRSAAKISFRHLKHLNPLAPPKLGSENIPWLKKWSGSAVGKSSLNVLFSLCFFCLKQSTVSVRSPES